MKLKFLLEGISSTVYHTTNLEALFKILESNTFKLADPKVIKKLDPDATDTKINKGLYSMSLSRSKAGGFQKSSYDRYSNVSTLVTLVLDGRKLGETIKGKPVHFWSIASDGGKTGHFSNSKREYYDEQEDRIFSKKPIIPNAKSYIKSIHILFLEKNKEGIYSLFLKKAEERIEKLVKENQSIPIYLYKNKKDMLLLRNGKRLNEIKRN